MVYGHSFDHVLKRSSCSLGALLSFGHVLKRDPSGIGAWLSFGHVPKRNPCGIGALPWSCAKEKYMWYRRTPLVMC